MICPQCKEQIEVGEAHEEAEIGNRVRYFHVGHLKLYKQETLNHYQEQLRLVTVAGLVH